MSNQKITEVVVYTLKPEAQAVEAFGMIREMLKDFEGFESIETQQDLKDSRTYMDRVTWGDEASAMNAQAGFEAHPKFAEVAGLFQESKFFSHFKPFN